MGGLILKIYCHLQSKEINIEHIEVCNDHTMFLNPLIIIL